MMRQWKRRWQRLRDNLEDSKFLKSGFLAGLPSVLLAGGMIVMCLIARQAHLLNKHIGRYETAVDKTTEEKTKRLSVDIPQTTHMRFKTACSATGRKMTREIEEFINKRTAQLEKTAGIAR